MDVVPFPVNAKVGPTPECTSRVSYARFFTGVGCPAEIRPEEGTSVVSIVGCLADVSRPRRVFWRDRSMFFAVAATPNTAVDVVLGDDRRWFLSNPCSRAYVADTSVDESISHRCGHCNISHTM